MKHSVFAYAFAAAAFAAPASALTISNGGPSSISPWGTGGSTPKYGQTFVAPDATTLDSMTFHIDDKGTAIEFQAYVFEWDEAQFRATGPALFTSGSAFTTGIDGFAPITVSTGGVSLTESLDYVAFFFASTPGGASWSFNNDAMSFASGSFVFQNEDTLGGATGQIWENFAVGDLGFTLEFSGGASTVPVPAALPMLLSGIGALGFAARRRKSKA